ncbi:hypothetical protein [Azohydromonas australica]|uniref:hypothetical protein n=1 Tax=Azohydromonas australica TaxID=364039 RepID=UPI0012EB4458|nr:hypothetical protein [Azohydromonas australica]
MVEVKCNAVYEIRELTANYYDTSGAVVQSRNTPNASFAALSPNSIGEFAAVAGCRVADGLDVLGGQR